MKRRGEKTDVLKNLKHVSSSCLLKVVNNTDRVAPILFFSFSSMEKAKTLFFKDGHVVDLLRDAFSQTEVELHRKSLKGHSFGRAAGLIK